MSDEWTTAWLQKDTAQTLKRLRDEARLEARASGLPIIGIGVGGVRGFVNEGETDKLVPLSTRGIEQPNRRTSYTLAT